MNAVVEVKNLTKEYKQKKAVDDLSFEIRQGEILGLLGPNGSGKSTTINCILSLLKYSAGSIKIFGAEMTPDAYKIKRDIGVIFQEVAVFEELTVYENIDYFCGLYVKDKQERKKDIEDAIALVGLDEFRKYYPKQLSGGLLRRLNIACGIAHKPKLIFLDEPTVAVDPQSRNNILDGIRKLRDDGATICYTTHYMEEVEILCDRIIILDRGKIIAQGPSDELKALNVDKAEYAGHQLVITYKSGKNNVAKLIEELSAAGITCNKIFSERPTLNDVFLELTGKELRD